MSSVLRVIVFDVEHGSCAFIRTPSGHGILIDCGRKDSFSPARFLASDYGRSLTSHQGFPLTALIVSHPHDDHIEDIQNLTQLLPPAILVRQFYSWPEIKSDPRGDYENLDAYVEWQRRYNQPTVMPSLGADLLCDLHLSPEDAKRANEEKFINNSSIPVVLTYRGPGFQWRFLFAGDLEVDGWRTLLANNAFRTACKHTDFFITAHHGHSSGYTPEIIKAFQTRPLVNIVSAHRRDESVEDAYSREENAQGVTVGSETRRMLSTRNDGSIIIDIHDTDKYSVTCVRFPENEDRPVTLAPCADSPGR